MKPNPLTVDAGAPPVMIQARRIKAVSASEQIRDALRERIVSLELVPGQALSRLQIAELFGVSQTPLRDAMMKLEQEGLLVIYPQSKTEVSKIDVDQARETQFLRLSLELEATRHLAEENRNDPTANARRTLLAQEAALASGDIERFAWLDKQFHQSLCKAAGVAGLWRLVDERSGHIDRLRNLSLPDPGKPASILRDHDRILTAIEAGDTAATSKAVREHLSGTLASVELIIGRNPGYF